MADDNEPARLHPSDIAAIVKAMREAPVRFVPDPSDVPTGIDARVISEAVRALVGEKTAYFLTREQIEKLIIEVVSRGGLEIDEAHREQTAEALRAMTKWHKRLDKVMAGLALTLIGALVTALAKLIGINIPMPTGGGGG